MTVSGFAVAGLHKLTTLDFPGVVSAIVFTQGCNFHCPYCHNPHLIPAASRPQLEAADVLAFLDKRSGLLDGVVISGGEPCLQPGLPNFCREAKRLGYTVKLDTNGSRPEVLTHLLTEGLVDYVAMDCKTGPESYYPALCAEEGVAKIIRRSADILQASAIAHEFRTTCVAPFVTPESVANLATGLIGRTPWYLQKGNLSTSPRQSDLRACSEQEISEMVKQAASIGCTVLAR